MTDKVWYGLPPEKCDICGAPITKVFIDGATHYGPWGIMCVFCHAQDGRGLGIGRGQKYELAADGVWHKAVRT